MFQGNLAIWLSIKQHSELITSVVNACNLLPSQHIRRAVSKLFESDDSTELLSMYNVFFITKKKTNQIYSRCQHTLNVLIGHGDKIPLGIHYTTVTEQQQNKRIPINSE